MKTTLDYLDDAKKKLGIESDYKMKDALGLTKQAISNYRHRRSIMNREVTAKLEEILEVETGTVEIAAQAEREADPRVAEKWRELWKRLYVPTLAVILAVTIPALSLSPSKAYASKFVETSIHYTQ